MTMHTHAIDPFPAFSNPVPLSRPDQARPGATPAFLVGQDRHGRWRAVEVHGKGGGLFVDRDAALRYALGETDRRPGAVTLASPDMLDACDFKGLALI